MKTSLVLFFIIFSFQFLPTEVFAQAIQPDTSGYIIAPKCWSAQFDIGTYINTSSFESYSISVKKHLTTQSALRLGIGYNNTHSSGNDVFGNLNTLTTLPSENKYERIYVAADFLFYPNPRSIMKMFFGGGPTYKFQKNKYNTNDVYYYTNGISEDISSHDSQSWGAGINALFGVEWFPFRNISLIAEYNANVF